MKPTIGVVGVPYIDINKEILGTNTEIINKINAHGGRPIGIFPGALKKTSANDLPNKMEKQDLIDMLKMCDAIVKADANCISRYEEYLIDRAIEKGVPFLGIDEGMQAMASHGSKRVKDSVKNEYGFDHNVNELYAHNIFIKKASNLYNILGKEEITVNSSHDSHTILSSNKFIISAYAQDYITEAIENPNHHFQIGVQWHPELLNDENSDKLFAAFIEEATKQKVKKLYFHR